MVDFPLPLPEFEIAHGPKRPIGFFVERAVEHERDERSECHDGDGGDPIDPFC
jgi:hypothetical protein